MLAELQLFIERSIIYIYRSIDYALGMADSGMREPTLLILTALVDGKKHGYGLIKEAFDLSVGRVQLKAGTLYAALDRLSDQGLVEMAGEEIIDGRLRRYYSLTEHGLQVLEDELSRLEAITMSVRSKVLRQTTTLRPIGSLA